jgi:hypothetical protein
MEPHPPHNAPDRPGEGTNVPLLKGTADVVGPGQEEYATLMRNMVKMKGNLAGGMGGMTNMAAGELGMGAMAGPIGLAVEQAVKQIQEGLKNIGEGAREVFKDEKLESKLSGGGQMLEGFGQATFNPLVEHTGKFVRGLGDATTAVREWVKGIHDANMRFADFSGGMANVKAQQEVRQFELDRTRGDRRADSADALARSMHQMNVQFAKIEDRFGVVFNEAGAKLADIAEGVLSIVNKMIGEEAEKPGDGDNLIDSFNQIENRAIEEFGRPVRMR